MVSLGTCQFRFWLIKALHGIARMVVDGITRQKKRWGGREKCIHFMSDHDTVLETCRFGRVNQVIDETFETWDWIQFYLDQIIKQFTFLRIETFQSWQLWQQRGESWIWNEECNWASLIETAFRKSNSKHWEFAGNRELILRPQKTLTSEHLGEDLDFAFGENYLMDYLWEDVVIYVHVMWPLGTWLACGQIVSELILADY